MSNVLKITFSILFILLHTGCLKNGGGTDTGPALTDTPNQSGPQDPTNDDTLTLFSSKNENKDERWIDTGENNSLEEANVMNYFNDEVYGTTSDFDTQGVNMHSHYFNKSLGSSSWTDYKFSGSMMIDDPQGSIGVTFYSDFPYQDRYYRLRRYVGRESHSEYFHFSMHSWSSFDTDQAHCSSSDGGEGTWVSDINPDHNVWYQFEIDVKTHNDHTFFSMKIWEQSKEKPDRAQIECYDFKDDRIQFGTVGVWMGTRKKNDTRIIDYGRKYFKHFTIQKLNQ